MTPKQSKTTKQSLRKLNHALHWVKDGMRLVAIEPDEAKIRLHAEQIAAWYNDPHNHEMMTGLARHEDFDVIEFVTDLQKAGGHYFLLFCDGQLVGDGDFRNIKQDRAEFTLMIGGSEFKGKGLGTAFTTLLHAFAFDVLNLSAVYLTTVFQNEAALRCYAKVGYVRVDRLPEPDPDGQEDDIPMVLHRDAFRNRHHERFCKSVVDGTEGHSYLGDE